MIHVYATCLYVEITLIWKSPVDEIRNVTGMSAVLCELLDLDHNNLRTDWGTDDLRPHQMVHFCIHAPDMMQVLTDLGKTLLNSR